MGDFLAGWLVCMLTMLTAYAATCTHLRVRSGQQEASEARTAQRNPDGRWCQCQAIPGPHVHKAGLTGTPTVTPVRVAAGEARPVQGFVSHSRASPMRGRRIGR